MTHEELELMTKMNAEGLSDFRATRMQDNEVINKNNEIISNSFKNIAHDIGTLQGRVDALEVLVCAYTGYKIAGYIWKKFKLDEKLEKFLDRNNPQEKEASNDEFIEDDI